MLIKSKVCWVVYLQTLEMSSFLPFYRPCFFFWNNQFNAWSSTFSILPLSLTPWTPSTLTQDTLDVISTMHSTAVISNTVTVIRIGNTVLPFFYKGHGRLSQILLFSMKKNMKKIFFEKPKKLVLQKTNKETQIAYFARPSYFFIWSLNWEVTVNLELWLTIYDI